MEYYINAWIDCSEPKLEIIDKGTNKTILTFFQPQITEMVESGDLNLKDLCCNERHKEKKIITDLLTYFFKKKFRQDLKELRGSIHVNRNQNVVSLFN